MSSPVDTSVKFYRDDFPGAPVLAGAAGATIGLLDGCLVTGFGLRTATSVVVAGGVATVTLPSEAKNPNLLHSVLLVDGVTGSMTALNGEQRVTAASTTTVQFATAVADGTATGTITVKTAAAGWEKRFTGTNKAVYCSLAPESLGMHLWVNDAGTTACNVRGFEAMSDVDSGTGAFPTVPDSATGGFWAKSTAINATANRWDFFADSRAFYFCPAMASGATPSYIGQSSYFFGDFVPYKSGDAFSATLFSATNAPYMATNHGSVFVGGSGTNTNRFPRGHSGLGSAVAAFGAPQAGNASGISGADAWYGTFPPAADGALRGVRVHISEGAATGTAAVLRGHTPGGLYVPQSGLGLTFSRGDTISIAGRRHYCVYAGMNADDTGTGGGRAFLDITGPWRD